jgi:mannose-6-phosphate isomerase-like protein (cupin superfamily)
MTDARILRGGEGSVAQGGGIPWLFKAGAKSADGFDFLVGDIPYFSGPPLHRHRDQTDTFYILENVLTVQVEGEFFELGPGDFASVPAGLRHTFDNVRADQPPVKAVNLMVPGGLDLFFEELGALGERPAEADFHRVGTRNGVAFVGPPLRVTLGLAES